MKPLYTLIIAMVAFANAGAAPIITATQTGNWNASSTWDLNRKPMDGDIIVIPATLNVTMTSNVGLNNVTINVYGMVKLSSASLILNTWSTINVYTNAKITGSAFTEQIWIGFAWKFIGSGTDVNGPKYADNNTGFGFAPLAVLPVTFVSFNVMTSDNTTRITWTTTNETNNNHFEVQRSTDGSTWSTIGSVLPNQNSGTEKTYTYSDRIVNAVVVYYRVKQVDNDGNFTYTQVQSIRNSDNSTCKFIQSHGSITIQFADMKRSVAVRVFNLNGQQVIQESYQSSREVSVRVDNIVAGVYVVQVIADREKIAVKKIML